MKNKEKRKTKNKMFTPYYIMDERVGRCRLSINSNAITILEQNMDKVYWFYLSSNPNAIHILTKLDTEKMRAKCKEFTEELVSFVFHPLRLERMSSAYHMDMDEYNDLF